jgi:hypothetical protein
MELGFVRGLRLQRFRAYGAGKIEISQSICRQNFAICMLRFTSEYSHNHQIIKMKTAMQPEFNAKGQRGKGAKTQTKLTALAIPRFLELLRLCASASLR